MSIDLEAIEARANAATTVVFIGVPMRKENREFLEHAKDDVADLLAEVERLNAENEAMQGIVRHAEELDEQLAAVTAERDEAVEIGDALCEEVENCYGRETELTQRWHERSGENG